MIKPFAPEEDDILSRSDPDKPDKRGYRLSISVSGVWLAGPTTSQARMWSTCRGMPSRVRRTNNIRRPVSTLANSPCSRNGWRSVCELMGSRSAPAIC